MTERARTLVVEDDPAVAVVHREFVESHPRFVVVGEARNGADALRLAAALRPDLVLLDLHLPDIGGLDVLRRLRLLPGPPVDVVATTAARELDSVRQAMAGGVVAYLVKPFSAAALRERLDEVWQRREDVRRAQDTLGQDEVDQLLAGPRSATALPPKGLSERSRTLVHEALVRLCADPSTGGPEGPTGPGAPDGRGGSGIRDASAVEVAEAVGMSRVSARRYLEHLVAEGHARVSPRYGATGRPENRYRPT
ncbi:Response regulator of citrate/malate metabolism [Promicromonospora umidemergens]|uniref:Transcriptional regulatory protein n=1 Tax=Promicromonospora umidemergens TaxID=629679 RepID=A0ABP8Y3R4_9MICO|nr:response regulator [Promicromonospora umidemergens]MCP2284620.1 Response regulator of citrate/malate metabolism [Promicromonospora umidemergens]